jgi:DNA modification methylase
VQFDKLYKAWEGDVTEDDYNPPPLESVKTDIVRGDIFEITDGKLVHRLLCGDSTLADDVTKLLDGKCPNLMITDPPYGVEYDANWRNEMDRANGKPYGARAIGKVAGDKTFRWLSAYQLFKGNIIYIWCASQRSAEVHLDIIESGFVPNYLIIWNKNCLVIGRGDYHWKHEPCWYATRKGKRHDWVGDRKQTTVWDIDKPQKSETGHSTQKPVECMARPIRNHSGDVYDPFGGSGTTMVAAHQLGRNCAMIEIMPAYCQIILDRLKALVPEIEIKKNGIECSASK